MLNTVPIQSKYFAEGLTIIDNKHLLVLTWREQTILWYNLDSLDLVKIIPFEHNGYGLAWNSDLRILYATNSSHFINHFSVDTEEKTLQFLRAVPVFGSDNVPITHLNELEYSRELKLLFSNIWQQNLILAISPDEGRVDAWMDLSSITPKFSSSGDVLNGIAFRNKPGLQFDGTVKNEPPVMYVTGKLWPQIYELEIPSLRQSLLATGLYPLASSTSITSTTSTTTKQGSRDESAVSKEGEESDKANISTQSPDMSPTNIHWPALAASLHSMARLCGLTYVILWTISWYPQCIVNRNRQSVAGTSLDMTVFNVAGFSFYCVFTCAMYVLEMRYALPHAVEISDVVFSSHALFICCFYAYQAVIYDRGGQTVSKSCSISIAGLLIVALVHVLLALSGYIAWHPFEAWTSPHSGSDWRTGHGETPPVASWSCLSAVGMLKAVINLLKYIPQVILNHQRRSTEGMEISQYAMDFGGGLFSILENAFDALATGNLSYFSGNIPKLMVAMCSMMYDVVLMVQHFYLYKNHPLVPGVEGSALPNAVRRIDSSASKSQRKIEREMRKKRRKGFELIPSSTNRVESFDLFNIDAMDGFGATETDDSLIMRNMADKGILKFATTTTDSNNEEMADAIREERQTIQIYGAAEQGELGRKSETAAQPRQQQHQVQDPVEAYYSTKVGKFTII